MNHNSQDKNKMVIEFLKLKVAINMIPEMLESVVNTKEKYLKMEITIMPLFVHAMMIIMIIHRKCTVPSRR